MSLSDRLRKVYRRNCNSMSEFAELIGVSKSSVEKWIHQGVYPRKDKLKRISKTFNVSMEWLEYGIESTKEKNSNSDYVDCAEKDRIIQQLEEKIRDKEEIIASLREQIKMYKQQLDEYADKSKRA